MDGFASGNHRAGHGRSRGMWTTGFALDRPGGLTAAFAAVVAPTREHACEAIGRAFGTAIDPSRLSPGFDPEDPYAELLVSPRLADEIRAVASNPASRGGGVYEVHLQRTFG